MKNNYDFSKMRKVPHPLLGKTVKLTDNVGDISDEEFDRKLEDLEPDERDIAIRLRKRRRLTTNVIGIDIR
jgi:hypothetical protein